MKKRTEKTADIQLTGEQIKFIDENWSSMSLIELTKKTFNNEKLDGRSAEGRAVRVYLIEQGREYKTTEYKKLDRCELTDSQKEYIMQHIGGMRPYELARIIFEKPNLSHASIESITIQDYVKKVNPNLLNKEDEVIDGEYVPPKTFSRTWRIISDVIGSKIPEEQIAQNQAKYICVNKCTEFLNYHRFVVIVNSFTNKSERELFETEFIRSVWDKPDLSPEEVNLYINLSSEYVTRLRIDRLISKYTEMSHMQADTEEGKRLSMALAETIKNQQTALHQSNDRQTKLVADLAGKRSSRRASQIAKAKSLVTLVEAVKDESERKNLIKMAEARKKLDADEIGKQETMDELLCRVYGISPEEVLE